ncbi:MAG: alkaline phosphatase family protein [Anaerolineae bacterium]
MPKRIAVLAVIPLLLAAMGYGGQKVMEQSWDELVNYQSPYTNALPAGQGGEAPTDQVVIVLQDGLRLDASRELETWNKLRAQGADLAVRVSQPSLSIPSFTVINTGSYQEINGVTTNWYEGPIPPLDSVYCEAQRQGLTTAMVQEAGGPKLFAECLDSPIYREVPKDDRRAADDIILQESLAALQEEPNLLWIHFSGSDWSGHHYGGASEEYRQFAREIDARIAEIAEAMDLDSAVLILASDHGHIDTGGHGGWEEEVILAPLVIAGEGIRPGSYPQVEQADIAPTVATLLGIAVPTHNQGQPLFDLLDMPLLVRAERAVDVARQHQLLYGQYLSDIGASAYAGDELAEADEASTQGDHQRAYVRARDYAGAIRQYADEAKVSRLWKERLGRLPFALLVLVIPALYVAFYLDKRELVVPLIGAGIYFFLYNGYFFLQGLNWSISAFNEESMIPGFMQQRVVEGAISLIIAALAVGVLMRGKTILQTALTAVNTSFFVGFGLLLQVDLFYWLYGLEWNWYLPDLKWGFKYYLDLLQFFPTGLAALIAPFIGIAAKVITDRVSLLGAR